MKAGAKKRVRVRSGLEVPVLLAVLAGAGHRDVVSVQPESEGLLQFLTEGVEVRGRNLERRTARVTREVSVNRAGQVVDRRVLVEVRVHDDLQRLELFED